MKMRKPFILLAAVLALMLSAPAYAAPGPTATPDPAVCPHHFEVSVVKEATCVDKGLLAYTCAKCGLTYTAETLPTGEHTYVETGRTVTCTEDGQISYTCTLCGSSYFDLVKAPGHVPDREEPECTAGVVCTVCGQTLIPAVGHDYQYQYDAQRDENGAFISYGTWRCANCGQTLAATEGNAEFYYSLADEPADEEPADDEASPTDIPAEETDAPAPAPSRSRTGLWIGIALAALAVIAAEAVVLTRSLKKKSDDR